MNFLTILKILGIIKSIIDGSTYQIIRELIGLLVKLVDLMMRFLQKKEIGNEEFNESAKVTA